MTQFPVDAPQARVIKALEGLGFRLVREGRAHHLGPRQSRRQQNSPDLAQSPADEELDIAGHMHTGGHPTP
jgi:hypothetical protein